MIVRKVQSNKLEVDLEWNENGNHMSIRGYMLMSKQACIHNTRKDNPSTVSKRIRFTVRKLVRIG